MAGTLLAPIPEMVFRALQTRRFGPAMLPTGRVRLGLLEEQAAKVRDALLLRRERDEAVRDVDPANFVFGNVGGTFASGSNMRKPTPITRS